MSGSDRGAQARFGTWGGVFTPCVLTILGVIMFMRSGYVVGQAGLIRGLGILLIAKAITGFTTLSLAAIATNTEVRTGGVYFMISRTLGPDFGGTIGLTLFVSQAVSVAFYVIGFSEALFGLFPQGSELMATLVAYRAEQWVSSAVIVAVFLLTFKGADVAVKAQYVILGLLLVSVLSFLVGGALSFDATLFEKNLSPHGADAHGFWIVFAVFFPAATGITAGANMSGDLKDPGRSIPNGTLAAIGFTAVIYAAELVLLAGYDDQAALIHDPFGTLKRMSIFGPLVLLGVFAATLSSALGSFLGAPRILQAMGKDRLLRPLGFFGKGSGPADEPRRATVLTLLIALPVVWAGGLDVVAKVISMFFLIAYGMINLSAFVEGKGGNPSFRPRFKMFGWPAALIGALGCAVAMVKVDETYSIIAMVIAGVIYAALRGRTSGNWGNAKRGYIFARTRENLLMLEKMTPDPKNWRPVLAVLTDNAERDRQVVTVAGWLESGRGLLSILELVSLPDQALTARIDHRHQRIDTIHRLLREKGTVAFADSVVVTDAEEQLDAVLQGYSIGSLRPNTVIVGVPPPDQADRRTRLSKQIATLAAFGLNLVVYKGASREGNASKAIDVWWHGQRNGSLLTLFAYLTSTHPDWAKARIRMLRIVQTGAEHLEAERSLRQMMEAARLRVDVEVILTQRSFTEIIAERSAEAGLVLLGLAQPDVTHFDRFLEQRDEFLAKLPPTLLVLSSGEADLLA